MPPGRHQWPHRLAGARGDVAQSVGEASAEGCLFAGPAQLGAQQARRSTAHGGHREADGEPGADGQDQQVDDIGQVGGDGGQVPPAPAASAQAGKGPGQPGGREGGRRQEGQGDGAGGEGDAQAPAGLGAGRPPEAAEHRCAGPLEERPDRGGGARPPPRRGRRCRLARR